jgi:HPt (histidine-containing phosphotransfer) domain-containing protein
MKNKTAAFNSSRLAELFSNDYDSLVDLLHAAFASLGDLHQGLSKELPAGNRQASLALSHELKGVCSNIGAEELAALGGALESELRNSHAVDATKYLPRLNAAHEQFLLEARAYLEKLSREV